MEQNTPRGRSRINQFMMKFQPTDSTITAKFKHKNFCVGVSWNARPLLCNYLMGDKLICTVTITTIVRVGEEFRNRYH